MTKIKDDHLNLEDMANEVIARRDYVDYEIGQSPKSKEERIDNAHRNFKYKIGNLEKAYNDKSISNPVILAELLSEITRLLIKKTEHPEEKEFLISVLKYHKLTRNVFNDLLANKLTAHKKARKIGLFIVALVLYGSSIRQAQKSVEKWLNDNEEKNIISFKTIEKYYQDIGGKEILEKEPLLKIKNPKEFKKISFVHENEIEIAELLLENKNKTFPQNPRNKHEYNTFEAFSALKSAIVDNFNDPNYESFLSHTPLTLLYDWDDHKQFLKEVTSLK